MMMIVFVDWTKEVLQCRSLSVYDYMAIHMSLRLRLMPPS